MKKSLRIALTVAVIASLAPIALAAAVADPGGTIPHPYAAQQTSTFAAIIAAFLSLLGL